MSIDAVLGKSGSQTGCFYALLNWFRSPTGVSTMIEDYLLSYILSLYGRVSQRASRSIPQLQVAYPGPPHLPYLSPCILYLMRACTAGTRFASLSQSCSLPPLVFKCLSSLASSPFAAGTRIASLRAASPRSPVPSHPPPGQQRNQTHISSPPRLPSCVLSLNLI